jgi:transposase
MQTITTIGLDIAKSVFQVHGVDADGNVVLRRQLKRRYVRAFFQKLPPCLVGIEACGSSHYWSRELQAHGHMVRLMPPAYVKPYVKRQKNDAADAEAICEADTRLPEIARACVAALGTQLLALKAQILAFDHRVMAWHRSNEKSKRLDAIPGVGPVLATALVASVGDPKAFRSVGTSRARSRRHILGVVTTVNTMVKTMPAHGRHHARRLRPPECGGRALLTIGLDLAPAGVEPAIFDAS